MTEWLPAAVVNFITWAVAVVGIDAAAQRKSGQQDPGEACGQGAVFDADFHACSGTSGGVCDSEFCQRGKAAPVRCFRQYGERLERQLGFALCDA